MLSGMDERDYAAEFWLRVDRRDPAECWPWKGSRTAAGYGRYRHEAAARVALRLDGRPVASTELALHSCDNPSCVNTAHLRSGTAAENARDAARRRRHHYGDDHWTRRKPELVARGDRWRRRPPAWLRGEQVATAVLTEDGVRAIRARYAAGGVSMRQLAQEYGVRGLAIFKVIHRQSWAHVPDRA